MLPYNGSPSQKRLMQLVRESDRSLGYIQVHKLKLLPVLQPLQYLPLEQDKIYTLIYAWETQWSGITQILPDFACTMWDRDFGRKPEVFVPGLELHQAVLQADLWRKAE